MQNSQNILRENFHYVDTNLVIILALFLIVLLIIVVLYEIYRNSKIIKSNQQFNWHKFNQRCQDLLLSENEILILVDLLSISDAQNPEIIFNSNRFYETTLDKYLSKKSKKKLEFDFPLFTSIREKLSYNILDQDDSYTSSRQFDIGNLVFISNDVGVESQSSVLKKDEYNWVVAPDNIYEYRAGQSLSVKLIRPEEGEYAFSSQIDKIDHGELYLQHTLKLRRKQLRQFLRIHIKAEILIEVLKNDKKELIQEKYLINQTFKGLTVDMSAGGLSFELDRKLPENCEILLKINIQKLDLRQIKAKIVRVSEKNNVDLTFLHSVAFMGLEGTQQEKIVQFAHQKQIDDISWR